MISQVFTVMDKAVGCYLPPFCARSKGEAIRSFSDAANDEKHQFHSHAMDYVLMFLGEFDDSTGLFRAGEPVRVIGAVECISAAIEEESRRPLDPPSRPRAVS